MFDDWKFDFGLDLGIPPGRQPLMWCLIAFLLTFLVTRTIVRYIRHNENNNATPPKWWQPRNMGHGTTHIHHVVIGVVLVMVSGVAMVTLAVDGGVPEFTAAAIGFGIGAALVLDEFALILHLQDVYWSEDGRTSVDAVFAAVAVAGLLILGFNPLSFFDIDIWREDQTLLARATVVGIALVTLGLAVVVLLKGKVWTGLVGMFITPLLIVAAIRVSRPHAPWARWRYGKRPRRMHRSVERERRLRRPVVRAKLWLQHVVAGEPHFPNELEVNEQLDREIHPAPGAARRDLGDGLGMKYFYDTEFIDNGRTIELISIGVAAEDGREYYAISTEFDPERAGYWVRKNVLPKLPSPSSKLWRPRRQIRSDLEDFFDIDGDETIELWAWVGAYDHVVLCQLWGPMTDLPPAIPRFTRELRQFWEGRGSPRMPPRPRDAHDALVDARHNLARFRVMTADDVDDDDDDDGSWAARA